MHVFCFIFLLSNPQARRPNPDCNRTGNILDDNGCILRTPELWVGRLAPQDCCLYSVPFQTFLLTWALSDFRV